MRDIVSDANKLMADLMQKSVEVVQSVLPGAAVYVGLLGPRASKLVTERVSTGQQGARGRAPVCATPRQHMMQPCRDSAVRYDGDDAVTAAAALTALAAAMAAAVLQSHRERKQLATT